MAAPEIRTLTPGVDGPSVGVITITPDNTNALPQHVRKLVLGSGGTAGTVRFQCIDGSQVTLDLTATKDIGPVVITQVLATGTTATPIVGYV